MDNPYSSSDDKSPPRELNLKWRILIEPITVAISILVFACFSSSLPMVGTPNIYCKVLFALVYLVEPSDAVGAYVSGYLSVLGWTLLSLFVLKLTLLKRS
jgi:hypothetical protein